MLWDLYKYWPQFQGNWDKILSFKSSPIKQNFLELTSLQCKQSASTCKGPVSTNQISETYYYVPLIQANIYGFSGKGHFPSFSVFVFSLGPGLDPLRFTKILKVPISLLRSLQICMVIYLDDMLLISEKPEELLMGKDAITFLLTQLGSVINLKKSIVVPVQQIEFLDLKINYLEIKLFLPQRVEEIV